MPSFSPHSILAVLCTVGLLLAGCTSDEQAESVDALRGCPYRFPDNTSVDCHADVGSVSAGAVPKGWSCVEEGKSFSRDEWWQLWTDGKGRYGVRGHTGSSGDRISRIRFHADGSHETSKAYHHGSDYFAPIGQAVDPRAAVDWRLETWNFTGDLRIGPTTPIPAVVHASEFSGDLWFVWAFEGKDATFFAQSMLLFTDGSIHRWTPDNFRIQGSDYRLTAHAELPVDYHGGYVPRGPSPVPDLPRPDPLPGGSAPRCTIPSGIEA